MTFFDAMALSFLGAIAIFGVVVLLIGIQDARNKPPWESGATCMVCRKNPCVGCR